MKLVIIGGVAAGATAAARARRISESVDIILVTRGPYVSFANCGLPYFIARKIEKRSALLLQTPEGFLGRYGVKVLLNTEATRIDRKSKKVLLESEGSETWIDYDVLILAQGGNPIRPNLPGVDSDHVFTLWTIPDMDRIHRFITDKKPTHALIAGGGFIGLEMAEAFRERGLEVRVVELASQIMTTMDRQFGMRAESVLRSAGVEIRTGLGLAAIRDDKAELSDGTIVPADLVLLSVGVRPELALAKDAGLELGKTGAVLVDEELRTSDPSIFAAGDMIETLDRVSGRKIRLPLAGPANRQGRIAATNAMGGHVPYHGASASSVVKLFDHTFASTGLTEKTARELGFEAGSATVHKDHHAAYYPGAENLTLTLVYDRTNSRVLGAQACGKEGVEKRIDVVATALQGRLRVDDLAELDLSYAPPYSSANDPVNMVAFVAQNDITGFSPLLSAEQLREKYSEEDSIILDVRNLGEYLKGHVKGSQNIPVDELRGRLDEVPRNKKLFVHCKVGFRGHLAVRILKENGWIDVWNISGGYDSMKAEQLFEEVIE